MENEYDIDPKPITPEEVAGYARKWRVITECPEGASFTEHLIKVMLRLKELQEKNPV